MPTMPSRSGCIAAWDFSDVGHFHEVGFKFGRWLDLVFLQCILCADSDADENRDYNTERRLATLKRAFARDRSLDIMRGW